MTSSEPSSDVKAGRSRGRRPEPATWLGAGIVVCAGLLLAVNLWPPGDDRTASAGVRPRGDVRAADIKGKSEDLYDTSYETCAALGLERLRAASRRTKGPRAAARTWAAGHEAAVRPSAYQGCLHALRDEMAAIRPTARRD